MTFRNVAPMFWGLHNFTTVQITDLVTRFGPTGTEEVNAIKPGTMVWDSTLLVAKVFDGTVFLTVTAV